MPTFDIVSEVDAHELTNAVDQANREVDNRFDFKATGAKFVRQDDKVVMTAQNDFQLKQMLDILEIKCTKRGIDIVCFEVGAVELALHEARQSVTIRQGIDQALAKQIVKAIKTSKLKVQAQVQGEQVRVSGKKRDDLQQVIALLKETQQGLPLQYQNFRD